MNNKCQNPCTNYCAQIASCQVVSHVPTCTCPPGFTGDPFTECTQFIGSGKNIINKVGFEGFINAYYLKYFFKDEIDESSPCEPSPCGVNARCQQQNNAGSCVCLSDYVGNAYEGCRPECVVNTDCPSNLACIGRKCKDPCPGACGMNAECYVQNHLPICICISQYTGDASRFCQPIPQPCKINNKSVKTRKFLHRFNFFWIFLNIIFLS